MTHDQLARRVAQRLGISIRDARRVIDATAEEIAGALRASNTVALRGVGTLAPPRAPGGRTRFRASFHCRDETGDGTEIETADVDSDDASCTVAVST